MNWKILLLLVWFLAIGLRSQNFFLTPTDAHPMRQTDTESVAYYFATVDAHPLHPQASLIRPQTNTQGYFFLEFPAYQYTLSIFYRIFGTSILVARVFNLALFSASFLLMYLGIRRLFTHQLALWSTVIYSLIPSSIFFFGHAIHPDLFAITLVLTCIFLLTELKRRKMGTLLAAVLMGFAVGTRPFILMALPSLLVVLYLKKGKWWEYLLITFGSISIYGFWWYWQQFFPEADHSWQYWTLQGKELLYTYAGLKHLAWRNVSGEVIGRIATVLAGIGFIKTLLGSRYTLIKKSVTFSEEMKLLLFCLPWIAAIPVYWYIAPAGNSFHQYYAHVFVIPIILLAAAGAVFLTSLVSSRNAKLGVSTLLGLLLLYNGYRTSSYFFNNKISDTQLEIAKEIEKAVPTGKKIVYLAVNNSVSFSLAHRQGWMLGGSPTDVGQNANEILNMKKYGAEYAVWAKENNDISEAELEILKAQTKQVYHSEMITVYEL